MQVFESFYYPEGNATPKDREQKIGAKVYLDHKAYAVEHLGGRRRITGRLAAEIRKAVIETLVRGYAPGLSREPFAEVRKWYMENTPKDLDFWV